MKKLEIYKIWKSDYKISDFLITQIILKNLKINQNQLFLLDEISDFESIKSDFELYSEGFPIEYILKTANFYSLDFYVDQRVLIPRNDTEIMIKTILEYKGIIIDSNYVDECEKRRKSVERALAVVLTATEGPNEEFMNALELYINGKLTLSEIENKVNRLEYIGA